MLELMAPQVMGALLLVLYLSPLEVKVGGLDWAEVRALGCLLEGLVPW